MRKLKFLGLLLAFSFLFINLTSAQTTVKRVPGGVTGNAAVSLCSTMLCLVPWNYPAPSSHVFPMLPNDVVDIVVSYGSGALWVSRAAVDATSGYYFLSNGTNTILIQRTSFGVYEFFII